MKKLNLNAFNKRQVILAGLVVMIAVAGYVNLNYQSNEATPASSTITDIPTAPKEDDYFTTARLEKEKSRSSAMDIYRELIANPQSSPETKQKSQADLSASAKAIENEAILENIIKAKGFDNVIVYISESGANVIVKTSGLVPAQVAQIKDLVIEKTKITSEKIKIVEIK